MRKKKIYSFITIGFICLLIISCSHKSAEKAPDQTDNTALIQENIAKADELFSRREDVSNLREAVKLLAQIRNLDNRNYEVEWKFAKYNYFLGKMTPDEEESEKVLDKGEEAGRIASRMEPDKPEGYFWYGANLGEQSRRAPLTKGSTSVDDIQAAMNKVIEIQPGYQGAMAYDILAQIEWKVPTHGMPSTASPIRSPTRWRISRAALLVKVTQRISLGQARRLRTR